MPTLADVVRAHGGSYVARHRGALLPSHVRALGAIADCRTEALGAELAACEGCRHERLVYHSCRHRACPRCGQDATERWLARHRQALLPVPYFHVVFTLPDELRRLVRSHQRALFDALFRAAFEALASVSADPRHLGADIGALAVLHTWTRALEWHPHVHMLVPGGGLAPDGRTWRSARRPARKGHKRRKDYLVPERAVALRFRGRFLELARRALPDVAFPRIPWAKNWIVHIEGPQPRANHANHARPDNLLRYLGRYVHRTAITDRRITACDERAVTFTYRDSRDGRERAMTLPPDEFLRRFLQHVPPRGFHRVRAYGLLHPKHRTTLRRLQLLLTRPPDAPAPDRETEPGRGDALAVRKRLCCPSCKTGTLRLVARLSAAQCRAWTAARPRHDSTNHPVRAPP